MDEGYEGRQADLVAWIGKELCKSPYLIPLDCFDAPGLPVEFDSYGSSRMCDAIWWPVVDALRAADDGHIIDHGWSFGHSASPREPWGFVVEPYLTPARARDAAVAVGACLRHWGVRMATLPAARSAWYPGHCEVIIAYLDSHCYNEFAAFALRALFPVPNTDPTLAEDLAAIRAKYQPRV
jgi:hypothetical protein